MSRSRNLDRMTRYQWFESGFLQRRVVQTIGSSAVIVPHHPRRSGGVRRITARYDRSTFLGNWRPWRRRDLALDRWCDGRPDEG